MIPEIHPLTHPPTATDSLRLCAIQNTMTQPTVATIPRIQQWDVFAQRYNVPGDFQLAKTRTTYSRNFDTSGVRSLIGQSESPPGNEEPPIVGLSEDHPCYGDRCITALMRREGYTTNPKPVQRSPEGRWAPGSETPTANSSPGDLYSPTATGRRSESCVELGFCARTDRARFAIPYFHPPTRTDPPASGRIRWWGHSCPRCDHLC